MDGIHIYSALYLFIGDVWVCFQLCPVTHHAVMSILAVLCTSLRIPLTQTSESGIAEPERTVTVDSIAFRHFAFQGRWKHLFWFPQQCVSVSVYHQLW